MHHRRPPAGSPPWPLPPGADRSATSLARLLLDCLELLDVDDATVVANDTAGGLLLLSLATDHPALRRVGRLVLTNCESYDQFPPDALKKAAALCRTVPRLARAMIRLQLRSSSGRRRLVASVAASGLDDERAASFFGPARRDPRVAGDLVAAMAGFRPQLLIDAAEVIPQFDRPVLLVWGESAGSSRWQHAQRLASDFPPPRWSPCPGPRRGSRSTTRRRWPTPSPGSCRSAGRWSPGRTSRHGGGRLGGQDLRTEAAAASEQESRSAPGRARLQSSDLDLKERP